MIRSSLVKLFVPFGGLQQRWGQTEPIDSIIVVILMVRYKVFLLGNQSSVVDTKLGYTY
ncbi:unknown protein [Microcystis aeruginosa NIES-843]|uniref:Uncharacterized protein n=1 Tax=Microcystis aeruginosa (strain NIES-843 / IAM M-2473) TaxID=449447 RepID=B0JI05_MICAN|nr:unknown protein [Microcystis aeruginosa NIES-843]